MTTSPVHLETGWSGVGLLRRARSTLLLSSLWLACGEAPPPPSPPPGPIIPIVDLRADTNRDGTVDLDDPTDDEGEDTWTAERGAIFLANIDDDEGRCSDLLQPGVSDEALARCHDASDNIVNGPEDLLDLARLRTRPWPDAPEDAVGTLTLPGAAVSHVRLFRKVRDRFQLFSTETTRLSSAELRAGVELAIEARDIVRDTSVWDGYVDLVFSVRWKGMEGEAPSDVVRMRVSPVMTFHHLSPARTLFVAKPQENADALAFREQLELGRTRAGLPEPLHELQSYDRWVQDSFETGYMAMPREGGGQHIIRVNYRAPVVQSPNDPDRPLRTSSQIVFQLRGRDEAVVQQFQRDMPYETQTLNAMGNTETIPPYEKDGVRYPLGRLLRGSAPGFQPDPSFSRMLEAQRIQPPVYVDTSWLLVAHVDETLSFLPARTARGWLALVADPALARRMLAQAEAEGHGEVKLFVGQSWISRTVETPAERTISQVLADTDIMNESAAAALEIDAQLAILQAETGLTDEEIIRVPFLFMPLHGRAISYQPGTVNLLAASPSLVLAPDPHGPVLDGRDPFKVQFERALEPHGISVQWVDTWRLLHRYGGEVHCGTNATREIPEVKWWETGR